MANVNMPFVLNNGMTIYSGVVSLNSGLNVISGSIRFENTDYLKLPSGTTAQRPLSPETSYIRFNTTNDKVEYYRDGGWRNVAEDTIRTSWSEIVNKPPAVDAAVSIYIYNNFLRILMRIKNASKYSTYFSSINQ